MQAGWRSEFLDLACTRVSGFGVCNLRDRLVGLGFLSSGDVFGLGACSGQGVILRRFASGLQRLYRERLLSALCTIRYTKVSQTSILGKLSCEVEGVRRIRVRGREDPLHTLKLAARFGKSKIRTPKVEPTNKRSCCILLS